MLDIGFPKPAAGTPAKAHAKVEANGSEPQLVVVKCPD
jgi:hypothetical protein